MLLRDVSEAWLMVVIKQSIVSLFDLQVKTIISSNLFCQNLISFFKKEYRGRVKRSLEKCQLHRHRHLDLNPGTQGREASVTDGLISPQLEKQKQREHWDHWPVRATFLMISRSLTGRLCLKSQSGYCLRNRASSCPLAFTYIYTHVETHLANL